MTFPRLRAFDREWRRNPPVAWLVARFTGYEPPDAAPKQTAVRATVAALDAMLPNGRFRGS